MTFAILIIGTEKDIRKNLLKAIYQYTSRDIE
jgi:hypothetical protein